jgi:hypothetical protein
MGGEILRLSQVQKQKQKRQKQKQRKGLDLHYQKTYLQMLFIKIDN